MNKEDLQIQYHVVIQTAFIGDLFLSIPTLQRIKKRFPTHKIILVCKKGLGEYFLKNNLIDILIEVEKGQSKSYKMALQQINSYVIDQVFCLHKSFRSLLFAFRIKAESKTVFGHFFHKLFFKNVVLFSKSWPEVLRQLKILTFVDHELRNELALKDWSFLNQKNINGQFPSIPNEFAFPHRKSKLQHVAVFPGSVWNTKRWTTEGFVSVIEFLRSQNIKISLLGSPSEVALCEQIRESANCNEVNDLSGKLTLVQTVEHLADCDLIICNDSAPSHMAAAVGIPVISIFGPTTSQQGFRPWNNQSYVVELDKLECRPCGAHGHKVCPLGHHQCMKNLSPQLVIEAIYHIRSTYNL